MAKKAQRILSRSVSTMWPINLIKADVGMEEGSIFLPSLDNSEEKISMDLEREESCYEDKLCR